jgi:hypothetical protein
MHDPRNAGTADTWIKRNPTLVRLTGKHPFNGEPPMPRLMQQGFITPARATLRAQPRARAAGRMGYVDRGGGSNFSL